LLLKQVKGVGKLIAPTFLLTLEDPTSFLARAATCSDCCHSRKLAVLLHHQWVSGEVYQPLRNSNRTALPAAA
jgi:hypothetical protein